MGTAWEQEKLVKNRSLKNIPTHFRQMSEFLTFLSTKKFKSYCLDFSKPNGIKEMIYAVSKEENSNLG